jgi:type VI secretion system protein ImpL
MRFPSLFPQLEKLQRFIATPTGRRWFRIGTTGLGTAAFAGLIWVGAPFIGFGSFHPLEDAMPRLIAIFVLLVVIGIVIFQDAQRRNSSAEHLAAALGSEDSDAPVLAERMKDALSVLRARGGGRTNYLYDLPWYVLIGPPGSGKTTALVNSGLKFPLLQDGKADAVAGVGGTRYCDWWFTEDAVLIDTAGRYTTQDSDAAADHASWRAFLDLLKRYRTRQPINGVIVAISLEDLLTLPPSEITAHADAIRSRILELNQQLDLDFPVYVLFTKADLVIGFMDFFDDLDERGRAQVWGTTFRSSEKRQHPLAAVEPEFDALVQRIHDNVPGKIEREKDAASRVLVFGFPAQLAALKQQLKDLLAQIFDPARYRAGAPLRGFYFTSGTQEGTPIDKLLGALSKSFAAEGITAPVYSGRGKSFFLTNLIKNVIIGEAGFVSNDIGRKIGAAAGFVMMFIIAPIVAGAFWIAYAHNGNLIQASKQAATRYSTQFASLATSTDRDLIKTLPALEALRNLPRGYGSSGTEQDANGDFGLDQTGRLHSAAETAYQNGLERLLRPRLIYRMEEQLKAKADDVAYLYDTLKIYLMLGRLKTVDRKLLLGWMENDWAQNLYPDPKYAEKRSDLEKHVVAMLDLEAGAQPAIALNGGLVEQSQKKLASVNIANRAFDFFQARAKADLRPDWSAKDKDVAGTGVRNVFEEKMLEGVSVPYFYTRAGFEKAFLGRVDQLAEETRRDKWVLGPSGDKAAIAVQFDRLPQNIAALYSSNFHTAWQAAIDKLQVRNLFGDHDRDRPDYSSLHTAGLTTSPFARLLESIRQHTYLLDVSEVRKSSAGLSAAETIATRLQSYHGLTTGAPGTRPIDKILTDLGELYKTISNKKSASDEQSRHLTEAIDKLAKDAEPLPQPFQRLLKKVADDARDTLK